MVGFFLWLGFVWCVVFGFFCLGWGGNFWFCFVFLIKKKSATEVWILPFLLYSTLRKDF